MDAASPVQQSVAAEPSRTSVPVPTSSPPTDTAGMNAAASPSADGSNLPANGQSQPADDPNPPTNGPSQPADGPSPASVPPGSATKPGGFELWRGRLRSARLVVAPMVDQSEAAWRMLSRKYGAELCYTPMYHASVFVRDPKYRRECLTTYPEDRPLIIQFCANDPATLLAAARFCQGGQFDALDLNLGCPQAIARRGHYGAFLQDEWELVARLVRVVHEHTDLPVTCKIRIFDDIDKTIRYARMLESAGCQLLTVHGRTREMKGPLTGLADWDAIRAVREAVSIPVFANGNIQYLSDVRRCLAHTGVQGVMSAEGNLHNPALFAGAHPPVWQMADEYLQLARRYPCPLSYARGHVFKILHYCLLMPENHDIRQLIARASGHHQLESAVTLLRRRYGHHAEPGGPQWPRGQGPLERLPMSPLLCQPHEREPIESHLKKMQANAEKQRQERAARAASGADPPSEPRPPDRGQEPAALSKRKMKRLAKGVKVGANRAVMEQCGLCCNPRGLRCEFLLCRVHCRDRCYERDLDCPGHRILVRTKRLKAREWRDKQRGLEPGGLPCDGVDSPGVAEGVNGKDSGEELNGENKMDSSNGGDALLNGKDGRNSSSEELRNDVKMDSPNGGEAVNGTAGMGSSVRGEAGVSEDSAMESSVATVS